MDRATALLADTTTSPNAKPPSPRRAHNNNLNQQESNRSSHGPEAGIQSTIDDNTNKTSNGDDLMVPSTYDPKIPSGYYHSASRPLVGGSPAARRLLGLQVLKEESVARRRQAEVSSILLGASGATTPPRSTSPLVPGTTRSATLKLTHQRSPFRRRNPPVNRVITESRVVLSEPPIPAESDCGLNVDCAQPVPTPGDVSGAVPEVRQLRTGLLLAAAWDSALNGAPVDLEGLVRDGALDPEDIGPQRLSGGSISNLLMKRLQTVIPLPKSSSEGHLLVASFLGPSPHGALASASTEVLRKITRMHGRVAQAADRWEQLLGVIAHHIPEFDEGARHISYHPPPPPPLDDPPPNPPKKKQTSVQPPEAAVVDEFVRILKGREGGKGPGATLSNLVGDKPSGVNCRTPAALRAIGILFPESNDSKTLVVEALNDVATDLRGLVGAQTLLKNDVTHSLIPLTEGIASENRILRGQLIAALTHITRMQMVQNALESERNVVMDLLSSFEGIVHRQHSELISSCALALGAIDAGGNALQKQLTSVQGAGGGDESGGDGTSATAAVNANIAKLLRTFSEVKSRVAKTQQEASETYAKEVVGPLSEKLRKGTIDGVALSDEIKRMQEATGALFAPNGHAGSLEDDAALTELLQQRIPSLVLASNNANGMGPASLPVGTSLRPPMLAVAPSDISTVERDMQSAISKRPPSAVSGGGSGSQTRVGSAAINMSIRRDVDSAASARSVVKSRPYSASSISPEAANEGILSNALVGTLRSQMAALQSTIGNLSLQLGEAAKEAARQKAIAVQATEEAAQEVARYRAGRDTLLQERRLYFDALLLGHQQHQVGAGIGGGEMSAASGSPSRAVHAYGLKMQPPRTSALIAHGASNSSAYFHSQYTSHQLQVIAAALSTIRRFGNTRQAIRMSCFSQWRLFVISRRSDAMKRDLEDLNYCASVSCDSQSIYENFRKQHNQVMKRERGEKVGIVMQPMMAPQVTGGSTEPPLAPPSHNHNGPLHVSLTSMRRGDASGMDEGPTRKSGTHGSATTVINWSREQELSDLISRITTQQALLMTLTSERDDLHVQNTLLKRRLVALAASGGSMAGLDQGGVGLGESVALNASATIAPTANLMAATGAFPVVGPQHLQALIEENKSLLINPNLRKEKKKTLLGARDAALAETVSEKNPLTQSQRRASAGMSGPDLGANIVNRPSVVGNAAAMSGESVNMNQPVPLEEATVDQDEDQDGDAKTGMGGRRAVQQVVLRNPMGAGPIAAKAITDATRTLRGMDGADNLSAHSFATAVDPLIRSADTAGHPNTRPPLPHHVNGGGDINTNSTYGRAMVAAMPGAPGSPKQIQKIFTLNDLGTDYSGAVEGDPTEALDGLRSHNGKRSPIQDGGANRNDFVSTDMDLSNLSDSNFAQALAEQLLPLMGGVTSPSRANSPSGSGRGRRLDGSSPSSAAIKSRMRQIKSISKEEADLQRVADEVERNLAATSVGGVSGGVGGKGAVTLDAVQMNALRVYAVLHPILQGVLRRLKVVSLRIEPLPLYEATTQPIIAIVLGWVERNFSRLLHVLTCEDRLLRVKWRMAFLGIKLRSRIAATESDVRHGRTDEHTMNLIKLQLSEYWLILKGATSCRQHAEALRKGLQTSHMGSTPEKQQQLQREMLATVTALEDEAEVYVRRTVGNTFKARGHQVAGFDATLYGDNPSLAAEMRGHEERQRYLRDTIENEAVRRNARSAWAGVVLARPELSAPTEHLLNKTTAPSLDEKLRRGSTTSSGMAPRGSHTTSYTVVGPGGDARSSKPQARSASAATTITVNNDPSRLLRSHHKGSDLASSSRVNKILEGVGRDQALRHQRQQAELLFESAMKRGVFSGGDTGCKPIKPTKGARANTPKPLDAVMPTLLTPLRTNSASGISPHSQSSNLPSPLASQPRANPTGTRAVIDSNAVALNELRLMYAAAASSERAAVGRGVSNVTVRSVGIGGVTSSSPQRAPKAEVHYGCDLGPVVGPQATRQPVPLGVASSPISKRKAAVLSPLPRPTTTMLLKTDANHASTDNGYVARIVQQYDTHVLAHVVPDQVNKASVPATGPFEVFNSDRGRVVTDTKALSTETPVEATTKRLLK